MTAVTFVVNHWEWVIAAFEAVQEESFKNEVSETLENLGLPFVIAAAFETQIDHSWFVVPPVCCRRSLLAIQPVYSNAFSRIHMDTNISCICKEQKVRG